MPDLKILDVLSLSLIKVLLNQARDGWKCQTLSQGRHSWMDCFRQTKVLGGASAMEGRAKASGSKECEQGHEEEEAIEK